MMARQNFFLARS